MTSPKVFIEEQLARREELVGRIEMMSNHLAGKSENAVGSGVNFKDTTSDDIERDEAEIAEIDASIAKMRDGNA